MADYLLLQFVNRALSHRVVGLVKKPDLAILSFSESRFTRALEQVAKGCFNVAGCSRVEEEEGGRDIVPVTGVLGAVLHTSA